MVNQYSNLEHKKGKRGIRLLHQHTQTQVGRPAIPVSRAHSTRIDEEMSCTRVGFCALLELTKRESRESFLFLGVVAFSSRVTSGLQTAEMLMMLMISMRSLSFL
jgi:hypothetical protein